MARIIAALYLNSAQPNPPNNASVRSASLTAAASESTATTIPAGLLAETYKIRPEAAAVATNAAGEWMMPASALVAGSDTVVFASGTWSTTLHCSRAGGLLTADQSVQFQMQFYKAHSLSPYGTTHIFTGTLSSSFTVTTTKTGFTFSATGVPSFSLETGTGLTIVVICERAGQLTGDTVRVHTNNGASASRIPTIPGYTIQYKRSHTHSIPLTQAQYRKLTYRRRHEHSIPLTQTQLRRAIFPRRHAEAVPSVTHAQYRRLSSHRRHSQSVPTTAAQYRRLDLHRRHAHSISLSQAQFRRFDAHRRHSEAVPSPDDTQLRRLIARRRHDETVPTPVGTQARSLVLHRSHAHDVAAVQTQLRKATYRRRHDEALSEGGGTTVVYQRPTYVFGD